jgi:hypothetical protein
MTLAPMANQARPQRRAHVHRELPQHREAPSRVQRRDLRGRGGAQEARRSFRRVMEAAGEASRVFSSAMAAAGEVSLIVSSVAPWTLRAARKARRHHGPART